MSPRSSDPRRSTLLALAAVLAILAGAASRADSRVTVRKTVSPVVTTRSEQG